MVILRIVFCNPLGYNIDTTEGNTPNEKELNIMKKTNYKAVATLNENGNIFDVVIYSGYKTVEEAQNGIDKFSSKGYNIINTKIEIA